MENHAKELDNVLKVAVIKCTIDCSIYIKTPVGRQFLKQNQIPGHAAPTCNMSTKDLKLPPRLTPFLARRGRGTQKKHMNSNFMGTYLNSSKMNVENTNTRLNLRELQATIDVLPGNKKSVDTNDGQTLLSKVEEPISCEALNPYGTGLP